MLHAAAANTQTITVAVGQTIRSNITEHDAYRTEINFGWKPAIWSNDDWGLSLGHALGVMSFRDKNNVTAFSWAPNLILTPRGQTDTHPYIQLGFGVAFLSDDKFETEPKFVTGYPNQGTSEMGSHWQFESSFALGLRKRRVGIRAKIYHYSNAGLAKRNRGMDAAELGISYDL
jgi:hypothetical protein